MNHKNTQLVSSLILMILLLTGCAAAETGQHQNNNVISENNTNPQSVKPNKIEPKNEVKKQGKSLNENFHEATVVKNVDGDTIVINLNGREEKVRMLCIDTPETHHPRLGVQPYGPEASSFTEKTLYVGRKIQVETGIGDGRDKYGRLLAYIYTDGKMFNETLLEKGLARVAYVYAPNTKYVDEFYAIQKKAQDQGIGIWSVENYAREDGFHADSSNNPKQNTSVSQTPGSSSRGNYVNNPSDDKEANNSCKGKIKGNVNSHIYHVPGGSYYDTSMDNIMWFCSEKEAVEAGYRKSKR